LRDLSHKIAANGARAALARFEVRSAVAYDSKGQAPAFGIEQRELGGDLDATAAAGVEVGVEITPATRSGR